MGKGHSNICEYKSLLYYVLHVLNMNKKKYYRVKTLQNNPPRLPHILDNDDEGTEYQCEVSMCCQNTVKVSSLFAKFFPHSDVFNFEMRSKSLELRSGGHGGCSKISYIHCCKRSCTQAAVWLVAVSWRITALFRSAGNFLCSI
jgi:hypothetical protein